MYQKSLFEAPEVEYGAETVNVIPTKETVDYNRLYVFTDLSSFTPHPYQRKIKKHQVKLLKEKMMNGTFNPNVHNMLVDINTNYIYDGQHSTLAQEQAKEEGVVTKICVRFFEAPEKLTEQIELIDEINSGIHWQMQDRVIAHMDGDNELNRLKEFALTRPLICKTTKKGKKTPSFRKAATFITGDRAYNSYALNKGTFKANEEDWKEAPKIYNEVEGILTAMRLINQSDIPSLDYITAGWFAVHNDKRSSKKIEMLPEGMKNVYEFMTPENMDVRHTSRVGDWTRRFTTAVENAYNEYC